MSSDPAVAGPRVWLPFLIVVLIWGSTWIVIRDQLGGAGGVPPSWSVSYRFLVAGLGLAAVAAIRRERVALTRDFWMFAGALALLQFVLNFNFVYRAEGHITSGLVAVVFALLIVPNAVFARVFVGQRVTGRFVTGSAVAVAGVALLFVHEARVDPGGPGATLTGIALTGWAILSASLANVMQATQAAKRHAMIPTLAIAMLLGSALDAAFAFATVGPPVIDPRPAYLAGVLYLGLVGSSLAFTLYFRIIRAVGPAKAAYNGVMVPVVAMALSTVFEGYRWSTLAAAGAVLAMAGLVIALGARRVAR
ncbi:multidrug transporter [Sphingomonas sp. Leaf412]|uniref:DMT family transporter n=1 Tax=Sphingomonas sp. Leaf412 TaxID=1736370 RepID=UPI000700B6F9|nr:EamA family transporter [Sphingomonas sp. Leaf412]KQT34896.1 multidrug transporter [Sphingomonas sp. Leaf412]